MQIDTTVQVAALIGGIAGAVLAAGLSYLVQIRVRRWEETRKRSRLWHVYVLQLTDAVAGYGAMKHYGPVVGKLFATSGEGFELEHQVAVRAAEEIAKLDSDAFFNLATIFKLLSEMQTDAMAHLLISSAEWAELPIQTVYDYNRLNAAAIALKVQLSHLSKAADAGLPSKVSAQMLYGSFDAIRKLGVIGLVLHRRMYLAAGISEAQAKTYLARSTDAVVAALQESIAVGSKLEKAVEALRASTPPTPSDQPPSKPAAHGDAPPRSSNRKQRR